MLATWEHRAGGPLTIQAYRRAGGVSQAVQTSAETVFAQLTTERRWRLVSKDPAGPALTPAWRAFLHTVTR